MTDWDTQDVRPFIDDTRPLLQAHLTVDKVRDQKRATFAIAGILAIVEERIAVDM